MRGEIYEGKHQNEKLLLSQRNISQNDKEPTK